MCSGMTGGVAMPDSVKPNPQAFQAKVTPYLCAKGAARALAFYQEAFGATEMVHLVDDQGRVSHAEIQIGGASIYLADEFPEIDVLSPETIGGSPVLIVLQVP